VIELYPSRSAEYLLVITAPGARETGRVQLWANRQLARSLQAKRDRAWGIGVSVMADIHLGYLTGPLDPDPTGGSSGIEGCLVVGSSGRLSGCLGFNYQQRGNEADAVTWYFIEPRARVVSVRAFDRPLDVIVAVRVAQGNLSRVSVDPSLIAPGFLIAYHLDDRPGVRGWRLIGQFYYAWVGNTAISPKETFTRGALGLSWVP
jgi:hypothetical protein